MANFKDSLKFFRYSYFPLLTQLIGAICRISFDPDYNFLFTQRRWFQRIVLMILLSDEGLFLIPIFNFNLFSILW